MNGRTKALVVTYGPAHERPWWWQHLDTGGGGCLLEYRRISLGGRKSTQTSGLMALLLAAKMLPLLLGARKRYDYVLTFECDLPSLIISLFQTLTFSRRPRHVILQFIMRERRAGIASRLKYLFMRFCFSSTHRVVCSSSSEAEYYREAFGWRREKAAFVPMHTDPGFLDAGGAGASAVPRETYLLSAGRTFRDYATLFSAVEGLGVRTVVVASPQCMPPGPVPQNVSLLFDVGYERLRELMEGCAVMVLPLEDRRISTGQSVLLQAMAMGKALVATRTSGTADYIEDTVNGLLVEPKDPERLREAVELLCRDNALRKRLGEKARRDVRERYLPRHYFENVSRAVCRGAGAGRRSKGG